MSIYEKSARMPAKLSRLACGNLPSGSSSVRPELAEILVHVGQSLDHMVEEIGHLSGQDDRRIAAFGPFLGRSLLEIAATALIGRLDPMRVFVVRRVQQHPSYDAGEVWKSAIRWQGDVVSEKVAQPWDPRQEYKGMTKALLGDYYNELFWKPAITRVLDLELPDEPGAWLAELKTTSAETFVARKRTEITHLYTTLSKGVHHEFVMPPGALYDRNTVADLTQRAVHVLADLAFVSHFIPHVPYCLDATDAVKEFRELEVLEVMK
jgi:hypothetical protein